MRGPWLHRCSIVLACAGFLCMLTGSAVTNNEARPYYSAGQNHFWLGAGTSVLLVAVALWLQAADLPRWLRRLGWSTTGAVAIQAALGLLPMPQPPPVRVAHAVLAQFVFLGMVLIAAGTAETRGKPAKGAARSAALRVVAAVTPIVVLAQVALGILFRHGVLEAMPHLMGALPTALLILGLALPVIYQPEQPRSLHLAARILVTITAVQVFLGMALFSMQAMDVDPSIMILVTMIHVAAGALTLTAAVLLAVLIRYTIQPQH